MEHNSLKDQCREILNTKDMVERYIKKVDLKKWMKQQIENDLISMVMELNYPELKMSMNCALWGKAYSLALRRKEEIKDREDGEEKTQSTNDQVASSEKPSLDETKGLDQLKQDLAMKMIQNTDDETLVIFTDMVVSEINERHPKPSPDVT